MRLKSYFVLFVVFGLLVALTVQAILRGRAPSTESFKGEVSGGATALPSAEAQSAAPKPTKAAGKAGVRSQSAAKEGTPTLALVAPTHAFTGIEGLTLRLTHPLQLEVAETQGLAASARSLYVSSVDPRQRVAFLYEIRRDTYTVAQVRMLKQGGQYHLGGLHLGAELLWAPLSGDEGDPRSVILGFDPLYLEVKRSFEVGERIAAVAQGDDGHLFGVSARGDRFLEWTPDGKELRRAPNPSGVPYGDMEVVRGSLICAGVDQAGGVLDVVDPASLTILARHRADAISPGRQWVTRKGFAFDREAFYFLPDDGPNPMLMTYALDNMTLEECVPSLRPQ